MHPFPLSTLTYGTPITVLWLEGKGEERPTLSHRCRAANPACMPACVQRCFANTADKASCNLSARLGSSPHHGILQGIHGCSSARATGALPVYISRALLVSIERCLVRCAADYHVWMGSVSSDQVINKQVGHSVAQSSLSYQPGTTLVQPQDQAISWQRWGHKQCECVAFPTNSGGVSLAASPPLSSAVSTHKRATFTP